MLLRKKEGRNVEVKSKQSHLFMSRSPSAVALSDKCQTLASRPTDRPRPQSRVCRIAECRFETEGTILTGFWDKPRPDGLGRAQRVVRPLEGRGPERVSYIGDCPTCSLQLFSPSSIMRLANREAIIGLLEAKPETPNLALQREGDEMEVGQ